MSLYILERADPRQLSINITSSSGRTFRWGPDEADASNIPSGMVITTQMPGGFGTLNCNLQRRPDITYPDFDRFAPVKATGAGGALTAFDGYLSSRPMNRGDSYSFSPEAIGWSGHLKDNASFSMVYIDRQLSKWGPMSLQRQINNAPTYSISSGSITAEAGGAPAIVQMISNDWASTLPLVENWYDAGANNLIAKVGYDMRQGGNVGSAGQYNILIVLSADDLQSVYTNSANLYNSSSPTTDVIGYFTSTPRRYAELQYYYSSANAGGAGATYPCYWKNIAVHGNHGLTTQAGPSGSMPGLDDGYYGGDIVADIVTRAAPKLTVIRGTTAGCVWNDTFVMPQLAFNAPVSADTAVQQLNQYYLYDYGVYENKAFFWQPPGSGRVWHLRVGDGVKVTDQGPQIETAFNGVVVQYTDPAGVTRYVGPPGYAGDKDPVTSATSSSLLQDTSASNPCNLYGRTRWVLLQMGTTTWQGAVTVGSTFLQTALSRPSSGSATVTGWAKDSTSRDWPVWMIRAGDTVVFDDTNDQTTHYVLSTNYNHDALTNTLTLDTPPNKLDWLLQRLSLSISALG